MENIYSELILSRTNSIRSLIGGGGGGGGGESTRWRFCQNDWHYRTETFRLLIFTHWSFFEVAFIDICYKGNTFIEQR